MTCTITLLVAAAALAAPAALPAQAVADAVVRPGDGAMSCPALAAAINQPAAPAADAAPPHKHHGGFLKLLGSAAPFIPGVGGIAGALVATGVTTVASAAAQTDAAHLRDQAMARAQAALAGPDAAEQRRARLTALFDAKGC